MKVYQNVTGYSKSVFDFQVSLDQSSLFSIAIGFTNDGGQSLYNTGFVISGYEGYIFDKSGNFVGGYSKNKSFNLLVNQHEENYYSCFIDNKLVNNYLLGDNLINCVEFDKEQDSNSSIVFSHKGKDILNFTFLQDSAGNILISSDNIVLTY